MRGEERRDTTESASTRSSPQRTRPATPRDAADGRTDAQHGPPATPGDVDGDGHPDAIWRNTTTGADVVWLLSGTSLINQVGLPAVADTAWVLRQ